MEIKAKVENLREIENVVKRVAKFAYEEEQADTYFEAKEGKLKIRESENESSIVFYRRPNKGIKRSEFLRIDEPKEVDKLKQMLANAIGVKRILKKTRKVFFKEDLKVGEVLKVNLDQVEELGDFVELELGIREGEENKGKAYLRELMMELGIREESLVKESYADLE